MASLQATVEDYHSDASEGVSFAGRKSPNAANVSTKRSHPSDMDKEKPPAQERASPNLDLRSDSGYSSFTAATVSSADSAPSASAPANTLPQSQSPAPKTRRPTVSADQRQHSSSPRPKAVSRNPSQSTRRPPAQRRRDLAEADCNDPNCTSCGPNALPRRRPELPSSQSTRDVSMVSNPRSMRPDQTTYYHSPPSPNYTRQQQYNSPPPANSTRQQQYMQGPAVVQPTPRRRTSSSARQRPMSYGGEHGSQYWTPGMPAPYPSPPQERGPPPAASAYRNAPQYHQMPYMVAQPHANGYYPPGFPANQTSPPYDMPQRPGLSNRNSSNYGTRNQPAPIVTQDRQPTYSARYAAPQSATQNRFPPLQIDNEAYGSSETESSSEEEDEYDEAPPARALMPPPKMKRSQSQKRRPSLRHANTTQVVDRLDRRQSIVVPERAERVPERMDRRQSIVIPERSERERPQRPDRLDRRQSVVGPDRPERSERTERPERMERRQSIVVNDRSKDRERPPRAGDASVRRQSTSRPAVLQRQTQSYDTPSARVVVNNTKANRRSSSQIYDKMYENYAEKQRAIEERYAQEKAHEMQLAQLKALEEAEARAREDQLKLEQKRKQRASKAVYQVPKVFDESEEESESESESEEEVEARPVVLRNGRRRPTEVDSRKGKERPVEPKNKVNAAEDYISAQRGSQNPYADQIHRAAKRGSHIHSERPSDESSRSNGSDKQSQSARTVTTTNGGNEIRLRVDASAPLSLSFNGDMEGRTLHLVPVENGMADIVIGNARGESTYHGSERGSVVGTRQKAIMAASQARRDAEEMTERSSRSGRSRREGREREFRDDRDGQRHALRRRAEYRS